MYRNQHYSFRTTVLSVTLLLAPYVRSHLVKRIGVYELFEHGCYIVLSSVSQKWMCKISYGAKFFHFIKKVSVVRWDFIVLKCNLSGGKFSWMLWCKVFSVHQCHVRISSIGVQIATITVTRGYPSYVLGRLNPPLDLLIEIASPKYLMQSVMCRVPHLVVPLLQWRG